MRLRHLLVAQAIILLAAGAGFAANPLITDSTWTQGAEAGQFELWGEFVAEGAPSFLHFDITYGVTDSADFMVEFPYRTSSESGLTDMRGRFKWRIFERERLSFALKPGLSLPTGNEEKGLGSGELSYDAYLIATGHLRPLTLHLNAGYVRNENNFDARTDLYDASLAAELRVSDYLKFVANAGMSRNPDRDSDTDPATGLLGLLYAVQDTVDAGLGMRFGLNETALDYSVVTGFAVKF